MRKVFFDDFSSEEFTKAVWDWKKPWGNVSHGSVFTEWENVEFIDDGLRFFHTPFTGGEHASISKHSGLIMMQNSIGGSKYQERPAYQYGRFSAEITVPFGTHAAFWLLSEVRIRDGIRSILPEIDIAEFGLPNHNYKLNQAIHYWDRGCAIERLSDRDDYKYHKQKHKMFPWPEGRNLYSVEVGRLFTSFYINEKLSFRTFSRDSGSYMIPLFTHTFPNWYDHFEDNDVILHNIMIEQ